VSTSDLVRWIRAPEQAPLRVDFGGGWLDVPRHAREGAFIVNCAISPTVTLREWGYERNAGLGGSGAWALLNGRDGVNAELDLGVGWQDPAVISEGGLCVWHSGQRPRLEMKVAGDFLKGRMALFWTGSQHSTPSVADHQRDYSAIERAGSTARDAVWARSIEGLGSAVRQSYAVQRGEGMDALPGDPSIPEADLFVGGQPLAFKYCGGGFGGYAVYLFADASARDAVCAKPGFRAIEPWCQRG
jgi:hypothetical protein